MEAEEAGQVLFHITLALSRLSLLIILDSEHAYHTEEIRMHTENPCGCLLFKTCIIL